MIFCQSARVHIPEVMTKSFWVRLGDTTEDLWRSASARKESRGKRRKKRDFCWDEKRIYFFALRFFFFHPRLRVLFFIEKKFCEFCSRDSFFIKAELFLFFFANPLGKKRHVFTRIRTIKTKKVKKDRRARWKKRARSCVFTRFYVAWGLITRKQSAFYGHVFFVFFKRRGNKKEAFVRRRKKKKLSPYPEFFSLSLSLLLFSHLFKRKEDGI